VRAAVAASGTTLELAACCDVSVAVLRFIHTIPDLLKNSG
jgi:hypothetical protein